REAGFGRRLEHEGPVDHAQGRLPERTVVAPGIRRELLRGELEMDVGFRLEAERRPQYLLLQGGGQRTAVVVIRQDGDGETILRADQQPRLLTAGRAAVHHEAVTV